MKLSKIRIVYVTGCKASRDHFKKVLSKISIFDLVADFDSAQEAYNSVVYDKVDLVFTDIEMKENDGFWLAQELVALDIPYVFVTTCTKYLLAAFKACAIDYIVKPFTEEDIMKVGLNFANMKSMFSNKMPKLQVNDSEVILSKNTYPQRIVINNNYKTTILNLAEIIYFSAKGAYTHICATDGSKHVSSKPLKNYTISLQSHPSFIKVHRGNVINKNFVKAILRDKHRINALVTNGDLLEISPSLREKIYDLLVM